MNYKKLAKLANCSVSTVSKAFSHSTEISENTRQKIFSLAKKYNCFEKYSKDPFPKKTIALIVPEIQSDYYTRILNYLQSELQKQNFITIIAVSNFDISKTKEFISYFFTTKQVSGIIVLSTMPEISYNVNIPIVSCGLCEKIDSVYSDMYHPLLNAIKLLKKYGHTKIAFIGEPLTLSKKDLFCKAMNRCQLHVNSSYIFCESSRFENAGYEAMKKIADMKNKPTAIIAAYDYIAFGVMKYLSTHDLACPEDFSIVGFDDINFSSFPGISLTTIKTNVLEICDKVLQILLERIKAKTFTRPVKISVEAELIIRDSIKNLTPPPEKIILYNTYSLNFYIKQKRCLKNNAFAYS